ncbi:hypothetical protein [Curtobacterium sp. MCBD17_019]|uniref:hypothetical protein n=1 Tax=Curtobacterium sp. MCBD17_019 TaxID=2175669 RepID=UPI000DA986DF|nr:hypothetical protein [Curtobacterium sp. MCBD17_019]PZE76133.1 hypothetical protein DEI82_06460 [Curtobacterium sp. MCBD17_019]
MRIPTGFPIPSTRYNPTCRSGLIASRTCPAVGSSKKNDVCALPVWDCSCPLMPYTYVYESAPGVVWLGSSF